MDRLAIDWSECPDVERKYGVLSGAWVVKGTRIPVAGVIDNFSDGHSAEQIAQEIYDGMSVEQARDIIAFARSHDARVPG